MKFSLSGAGCAAALAGISAVACSGGPAGRAEGAAAILATGDSANLAALSIALGKGLGLARIEFGAGDPKLDSWVSVLPPRPSPAEGRSLATPIVLDLRIDGGGCVAVRRDTGEKIPLPRVSCRRAP